jgi:F-type H+-transporting ATPase subunit delta
MLRADLRGPSADAVGALAERLAPAKGILPTVARLASKVTGVGDDADLDMARMGEDLFGVASAFRAEPGLRRIATDMSIDASAKSSLMRQIFEGKISSQALELVTDAVQRRWTRTRDLADALEYLGVVALVNSADEDLDRLSDELFALDQLINQQADLRNALSDPARSPSDKAQLLRSLLEGKTLPATLRLAEQALAGSHRSMTAALEEYQKIAADAYGQRVAEVTVAQELTDDEMQRLRGALRNQYGRTVHLNVVLDPEVIGGMRVEIGDDVIDGTVASRLDGARRRLAG